MQYVTLEDTVYLYFASNNTSGSGDDGASAVYDVREGGAAAGAAPTLSGSATLLSHANYPAGAYEVAVAATAANGFAADKTYGVFCTLAVDSQNPTGFIGSFRTEPVPSNVKEVGGATAGTATTVNANVVQVLDEDVTESVAGQLAGTFSKFFDETTATAGTAASLPATPPLAAGGLAGHTEVAAIKAKTDQFAFGTANRVNAQVYGMESDTINSTALAASAVSEIWASVADSAGVTTLLSRLSSARAGYLDNLSAGAVALASNLTGDPYAYLTTNMGLLGANLTAADDAVMTRLGAPVGASLSADIASVQADADDIQTRIPAALTAQGNMKSDALRWNGLATVALPLTPTIAGRSLDVSTGGEGGIDWGNIGNKTSVASLDNTFVGTTGQVTLSIGNGAITANSFAADAIDSNALAASAVSEMQSGLSTYDGSDTSGTTTLLSRLSAARAGYLDNLSAGAVATAAGVAALNNLSAAQVLTQVNAALDTALTLPGAANPSSTPTFREANAQMYQLAIRKTVTNKDTGVHTVYAADGSTPNQTRTIADDGAQFTLGPLIAA